MDISGMERTARVHTYTDLNFHVFQHVIRLVLRFPSAKAKVDLEMNKAKLDIESKLVPKGAEVVRHLSVPEEGKPLDWILAEMEKMDNELGNATDWRHGKLSGAVYRATLPLSLFLNFSFAFLKQTEAMILKKSSFNLTSAIASPILFIPTSFQPFARWKPR